MIPYKDDNRSYRIPFINILLIIANVMAFFYQLNVGIDWSVSEYGFVSKYFWNDPILESYRLISSMFLHGGWLHIIGNMLFLWIFGDNVEDVFGHFRYLLFYIFAGISGAILQSLLSIESVIPMVGASAAISGVIASYIVFFPMARIHTLLILGIFITTVPIPAFFFILFWIIQQVIGGMLSLPGMDSTGGTAYFAHIGGITYGLIATIISRSHLLKERTNRMNKRRKINGIY